VRLQWRKQLPMVFLAVTVAIVTAACSQSSSKSNGGGASYTQLTPGQPDASPAQAAALQKYIPASLQKDADGFWNWMRLGPNPYANWTPPKAPWQFCYSSAYQGNSWRVEGLDAAKGAWSQLKAQNLVKGNLIVADANNNATQQATQINNMVQQKCQVIFVMQPPSTGLCQSYKRAHDKGVLVISMQTGTSCTDDIQVDFAEYQAGATSAQWLVDKLGGKGNIVECKGIPGVAASETRQAAAEKVFKANPGIHVDSITSQWTASTGKSQMLQYLATHPQRVDGVWDGGTCAVPAGEALKQAGRPTPYITGFEGGCYWLAQVKESGKDSIGFPQSGGQAAYAPFEIALRMLVGQKMKGNMVLYPLPVIDKTTFASYYKPSYTTSSTCNAQPAQGEPLPSGFLDTLFTGGGAPPAVKSPLLAG
jgi:ribose transport system substrate-binding protein